MFVYTIAFDCLYVCIMYVCHYLMSYSCHQEYFVYYNIMCFIHHAVYFCVYV